MAAAAARLPGCYSVAITGPLPLSIPGSITQVSIYPGQLTEMLVTFENACIQAYHQLSVTTPRCMIYLFRLIIVSKKGLT